METPHESDLHDPIRSTERDRPIWCHCCGRIRWNWMVCGGFHSHGATPIAGWFVVEIPFLKWMMTGGTPNLGNLHVVTRHSRSVQTRGTVCPRAIPATWRSRKQRITTKCPQLKHPTKGSKYVQYHLIPYVHIDTILYILTVI